jgi:tetratricopeptide (TPR) repeat protein
VIEMSGAAEEDKSLAKKILYDIMASNPGTAKRAFELLGMDSTGTLLNPNQTENSSQRRTRAVVLAMQKDRGNKLQAIRLLEIDRESLANSDRFMLARIYEQVGDYPSVRATLVELLRRDSQNPVYLSYFVRWLLQQQDVKDAEAWLTKLAKVAPDALVTLEMKIRLASAKKDNESARKMIRSIAEKPSPPWLGLAELSESVGLFKDAEEFYLAYWSEEKAKKPETILILAKYYARRDRAGDALDACDKAWENCHPVLVAVASTEVLATITRREAADRSRVKTKIEEAIKKYLKNPIPFKMQLAYIKSIEGDYKGSTEIYREILKDEPSALALNNLAYLVSLHAGKHEEALALVLQAKEIAGAESDILDTEALIRIARETPEDLAVARKLLQDVIAMKPSASAYFHLALLEQKANNPSEFRLAWREAKKLNLKKSDLHPLEWGDLAKMEALR